MFLADPLFMSGLKKKSTEVRTPLSAVLISSDDKRKVSNGMVTDD